MNEGAELGAIGVEFYGPLHGHELCQCRSIGRTDGSSVGVYGQDRRRRTDDARGEQLAPSPSHLPSRDGLPQAL